MGDPDVASSLGVARVTAAAPASTNAALNVRVVSGPSSVADFAVRAVLPSTYGDHGLRVLQSSAGDLNVTVAGYSTTVNVSSLAGPVIVRSSAADALHTVYQSTAADLNVTVAGYSTTVNVSSVAGAVIVRSSAADFAATISGNVGQASTVWVTQARLHTSSQGALEGSTFLPAQSALGLHVRQVGSSIQTVSVSTAGASATNTELVSSQANPISVYGFSITSTVIAASTVSFRSSLAEKVLWAMVLGTGSSGITGANLASNPPDPLFRTLPNNALTFHTPSAGPEFHIAVRYST